MYVLHIPGRDVTPLSHEGSKRKPKTVENPKLVCGLISLDLPIFVFLCVPLVRTEAADQKEYYAHPDVGEYDAHPDLIS